MRSDRLRLQDILDAIAVIRQYLPADRAAFDRDPPVQSHIYRHVMIIGEVAWNLSREIKDQNPQVPWRQIEGMRHIMVHDYFKVTKQLDHIIWAYHTTQNNGALERCYPGDAYVDILGKSAYGSGLVFAEYDWAVTKKKEQGKVIWWAELGIRGNSEPPRDCLDVLRKLESRFPELAGFVFWSDEGFYNVIGNRNAREFMADPKIVTLAR